MTAVGVGLSGTMGAPTPLVIPGCASYYRLELAHALVQAGDHDVAFCTVTSQFYDNRISASDSAEGGSLEGDSPVVLAAESTDSDVAPSILYTGDLRAQGIISEQGRVVPLLKSA